MDSRGCTWVECPTAALTPGSLNGFRTLPLEVQQDNGRTTLRGLPTSLILSILRSTAPRVDDLCTTPRVECHSKIKTAIIPMVSVGRWRRALRRGICGHGVVRSSDVYLGIPLCSPGRPLRGGQTWPPGICGVMPRLTWKGMADRLQSRAADILGLRPSMIPRAWQWNAYCVSLVIYPSYAASPPPGGCPGSVQA